MKSIKILIKEGDFKILSDYEQSSNSVIFPDSNVQPVSVCHVNLGFDNNLDKIESRRGDNSARNTNNNNIYQENAVAALENTDQQSTLRMDDYRAGGPIFSINNNSMKTSKVKKALPAVLVRNVVKGYGSGPMILNNFSMTVEKGTIYSLLGSSGCGKTTLLSCVVGLKNITEGEIQVFGAKPGTRESGVPGKRVGYMPQEIALCSEFSIREALQYFGTIYGMDSFEIQNNMEFLVGFLDLPDKERRIGTLSGGQKRRVSLAVSLIHSPELLILDEPTVGVDPLLRESIWNYLCKLVSSQETTVIITTHYIEEARQSSMIGVMRNGRLLVEKSPTTLLREYNTTRLEEIVLQLCRNDRYGNGSENGGINNTITQYASNPLRPQDIQTDLSRAEPYANYKGMLPSIATYEKPDIVNDFRQSVKRLKALIKKNYLVLTRNLLFIIFMILIPASNITLICLSVGSDPKPLKMGLVNHETNYSDVCLGEKLVYRGCDVENLSCKYLAKLPDDTIHLTEYETEDEAREAVKEGKVWGFMSFPEGYSDNMYTRAASGSIVDNETLGGSNIIFEMDSSNKQITLAMKKAFYDGYLDFIKELFVNCGYHEELGEIPLKFEDPIYGKDDTDYREYIAPSVLLGILFFFPMTTSAVSYIRDQKQGTLERSLVAGVQSWEVMFAFFVTEGCVILIQVSITCLIIVSVFGIVVKGSTLLMISLGVLMGLAGISMGFLISSFCKEEIEAVLIAMASFFPNFLLAGMMWPTQGLPPTLQYITYFLPSTLACEAIRSIVSRGWGFTHRNVWLGFVSTSVWIVIYWVITIIILRVIKSKK